MTPLHEIKMYLIAGLTLCLITLGGYHWVRVSGLEVEVKAQKVKVAETEQALSVAVQTNQDLEKALKDQNKQVEGWLAEAEARKKASDAALRKAKADAAKWKARYDKLLSDPPPVPGNDCESLNVRINQYLGVRSEQ